MISGQIMTRRHHLKIEAVLPHQCLTSIMLETNSQIERIFHCKHLQIRLRSIKRLQW